MRSKTAMRTLWSTIRMRTRASSASSGRRATSHANQNSPRYPAYEPRPDQRMRLAMLLTSLLALPLLGWLLERVIEHVPPIEELSAEAQHEHGDLFREMLTRERRAQARVAAPKTLSDAVLSRIAALPQAPGAPAASGGGEAVPDVLWHGSQEIALAHAFGSSGSSESSETWPSLREGALVRPAGVVLGVLWFWALVALWASCLIGLTDPTLALRVLEVVVALAAHGIALAQGVGSLLASAGANVPVTAGLSLLVLGLGLVTWMLAARQFNRLVLGA